MKDLLISVTVFVGGTRYTLHIYICDLGLAYIKTKTNMRALYSVYYISPDALKRQVGTPSDVWAIWLIIVELYTG